MVARRPAYDLVWHGPSDQPDTVKDRALKRQMRWSGIGEYARTVATLALTAPVLAVAFPAALAGLRPDTRHPRDVLGVAVDPDAAPVADQVALVRELGVRRILVRAPVWRMDRLDDLRRFCDAFDADVLIAILQDRAAVCDPAEWGRRCQAIARAFRGRTRDFQIGQAPNRTKWGCAHLGDYYPLAEAAMRMREVGDLTLAGPAVIDFEPAVAVRGLVNLRRYRFDACASLLYVDRRGAPGNPQYGIFDLRRKLALQVAINRISPRLTPEGRRSLWITEFNWPLEGTGEFAPTSPKECVSEEAAARFLTEYVRMALSTGAVDRLYWWQLVAPGYGLVDSRNGLRRRPAFAAMAALIAALPGPRS